MSRTKFKPPVLPKGTNGVKRYVCGAYLQLCMMALGQARTWSWRVLNMPVCRGGLTPKEQALLQKKHEEVEQIWELMGKLYYRVLRSCPFEDKT